MELEEKKRMWSVEDATRQHRIGVLMRRIDQVEDFVYYFTEDFQNIRHALLYILQNTDSTAIQQRIAQYGAWRDQLPKRIFGYGPGVISVGRKKLVTYWDQMNKPFEELRHLYIHVCNSKASSTDPLQDEREIFGKVSDAYEEFNEALGKFLTELDSARAFEPAKETRNE